MKNTTACPLDCYDACEVIYEEKKLKAQKSFPTQGFLCPHLNHYEKHEQIKNARYKGKEITLVKSIEILKEMISTTQKEQILLYRGTAHFGLMQEVSDHFFAGISASLTEGTLCDGAGEAGIIEGRGQNKTMSYEEIQKSEVVIFWGRNPHTSSSHLLPLLKGKEIIVIDPLKTKIAEMATLFLQIQPHTDLHLAMLLTRFLHIQNESDEAYIEEFSDDFEEYFDMTQSIRIRTVLQELGISIGDIGHILSLVHKKRVAIVCGVGVQKYANGADVMRAIDAFAFTLGLFGKEGCGVAYLGSSKEGVVSPFKTEARRVSKVNVDFSKFELLFVQGANPLSQMPNTQRVQKSMADVKNVVYFGLHENEMSERADLVIPAKDFLCKDDVRTSYGHNHITRMHKLKESAFGISEFDLMQKLCENFDVPLESESYYLNYFESYLKKCNSGNYEVKNRDKIAYKDGFYTKNKKFIFLDECDIEIKKDEKLFLITSKSTKSVNSQFFRDKYVYMNDSLGFKDGERVRIFNEIGEVYLEVKNRNSLREDCILIYSGTRGVNNLTTSQHALDAKSAIFQEMKVEVQR